MKNNFWFLLLVRRIKKRRMGDATSYENVGDDEFIC